MSNPSLSPETLAKSRGWLIAGGILSLLVGLLAMSFPLLFSIVLTQLLGAFLLANGIISFGLAIFGKHMAHRVLQSFLALIRIAAGLALLCYAVQGVAMITLLLAVFFVLEGLFTIMGAAGMKSHSGWGWVMLNGFIALVLGLMVYLKWPTDSGWILGVFYGINSIFSGTAFLMLGLGAKKG